MHRLKSRGILVLAVLGLFAISGIALADTEDDTVFNYGYDEDSQFFFWNVTSLDYELEEDPSLEDLSEECALEGDGEDPVVYEYTVDGDTITLTQQGEEEPIDLTGCGELLGGEVTGPEGQVNHGMFLKLFNEQYEGPANRGCLVRHIAQSDLGKDTQQVEADPDFEDSDPETVEGEVSFTTVETNCIHGNPVGDEVDTEGDEDNGPPQHVLDRLGGDRPGKPADAPGGRP